VTTIQKVAHYWDTLEVVHEGRSLRAYKVGVSGEYLTIYLCNGCSGLGITGMHPVERFRAPEWKIIDSPPGIAGNAGDYILIEVDK
jgi:hypothetical protein